MARPTHSGTPVFLYVGSRIPAKGKSPRKIRANRPRATAQTAGLARDWPGPHGLSSPLPRPEKDIPNCYKFNEFRVFLPGGRRKSVTGPDGERPSRQENLC